MTYSNPTAIRNFLSAALLAGCLLTPAAAFADAATPPAGAGPPGAEVDRLRKEVGDLRQMLLESKQVEQQHRELLLKLVPAAARSGTAGGAAAVLPVATPAPAVVNTGRVTGTVLLSGIPATQPVYVFVEDLRLPPVQGHSVDIAQREKQFWPQVIAVQRGTKAFFPNVDRATHNVFSAGPALKFDLGDIRSTERGKPVILSESGVVEIHCDVHPGMWSEVLVTPNGHFARVGGGGSFRLQGVPAGERVIAVWTAGAPPKRQTVTVTPQGTTAVDFVLNVPPRKTSHPNKAGQAYSSTAP